MITYLNPRLLTWTRPPGKKKKSVVHSSPTKAKKKHRHSGTRSKAGPCHNRWRRCTQLACLRERGIKSLPGSLEYANYTWKIVPAHESVNEIKHWENDKGGGIEITDNLHRGSSSTNPVYVAFSPCEHGNKTQEMLSAFSYFKKIKERSIGDKRPPMAKIGGINAGKDVWEMWKMRQ